MVRLLRLLLVVVALLVGVAGCGGDPASTSQSSETARSSASPSPGTPSGTTDATAIPADAIIVEVTVAGGTVTPADTEVRVPVGSMVRLLLTSDVADEAHVHGYELTLDLPPGEEAQLEFAADIPGVFEVETHEGEQLLCLLRVE